MLKSDIAVGWRLVCLAWAAMLTWGTLDIITHNGFHWETIGASVTAMIALVLLWIALTIEGKDA